MSVSSDIISKEFAGLFQGVSPAEENRGSLDDFGGVVSAAGGSGNAASAPGQSGVGSPQSQNTGGSSALTTLEGFAEGLLGPIPSIVSGIESIFGGGGSKTAPTFPLYEKPASIDFQAVVSDSGGLDASTFNQFGDPQDLIASAAPAASSSSAAPGPAPTAPPAGGGPAVNSGHTFNQTFNMQAFDGDGMMRMSDQIAASVRKSLLTSNSLADVITNDLN